MTRVKGEVDGEREEGGKVLDCAGNRAVARAKGTEGTEVSEGAERRRREGELLGSPSRARKPRGRDARRPRRSERRGAVAGVGFKGRESDELRPPREGWEQQHLDKRRSLGTDASAASGGCLEAVVMFREGCYS